MRIAIVLTARPSWAKFEPICRALKKREGVELQILACASALLPEFGHVAQVVEQSGYSITERIYSSYAGSTLETSAKETGALLSELASAFRRLSPDTIVVMADRHEVLAAAQAAAQLHIPLTHIQGGEVTGSIDDKVRDAITQLADVHCVATTRAKFRVYGLTGNWEAIHQTGCPSIDVAFESRTLPPISGFENPFVLVLQHPVTNEIALADTQMRLTCMALERSSLPVWFMKPGADAGGLEMRETLRDYRANILEGLPPNQFLRLMQQCAVLVGNSSVSVREGSFLGTPAVVVGSRQRGRERGRNVVDVPHDSEKIRLAVEAQIAHGRYETDTIYGRGDAGERIAAILCGREASQETCLHARMGEEEPRTVACFPAPES